jgi:mono/diheme cytochrome c family protein
MREQTVAASKARRLPGVMPMLGVAVVVVQLALPRASQAQDVERGARLFEQLECSRCHADGAVGDVGPRLAGTSLSLDAVRAQLRNPGGMMPRFGPDRISDEDIAAIYAWLQTLDAEPPYPTWFGSDLINLPTPTTPNKKTLDVHFSHRFTESIQDAGREGLWGLDSFAIPVFWFAYGITDRIEVHGGRSSINATWDYGAKAELLREGDVSVPIAVSVVAGGAYLDRDAAQNTRRFTLEVPVGVRVHERFSLLAAPFLATNPDGQGRPGSDDYSAAFGLGGTFRMTPGQSIDVEWVTNIGGFTPPEAIDLWQVFWGIKVGGHLFQIGVSNNFLYTPDQMAPGHVKTGVESEVRLGFNLVRSFTFGGGS